MQPFLMIAVLLTVTAAEAVPTEPIGHALDRAMGTLTVCLIVAVWAEWSARRLCRQLLTHSEGWARRQRRVRRLHLTLVMAGGAVACYLLRWPQVVREDWALGGWPLVDDVLILLPLLGPLAHGWAAYYEVDRTAALLGELRGLSSHIDGSCWRHMARQARDDLGLVVAPMLLVLAAQDLAGLLFPAGWDDAVAAVQVVTLIGVLLFMPLWLRRLWSSSPLTPGPLRDRLERTAASVGLRIRDYLEWHTESQVTNAAVAGFLPRCRYVFLTDRLLQAFDDDELEAVLLHEAAHVQRRHLALRLLVLGWPFGAWVGVQAIWPGVTERLVALLESCGVAPSWQVAIGLPVLMAAYLVVTLGAFARLLEYDADLWAAERSADPEAMTRALAKLARMSGDRRSRGSWMHPSLDHRITLLREFRHEPHRAVVVRRGVLWSGVGLVASLALFATLAIVL